MLILDDFGYLKKSGQETYVLFEPIAHRYETGSIIINSNQPFSAWDRIFSDEMMTVAAIDRLVRHATLLELQSGSYRRKAAMQQATGEQTAMLPEIASPAEKCATIDERDRSQLTL